jgi:uncharacterized repeat protein (TIGR01451 family)
MNIFYIKLHPAIRMLALVYFAISLAGPQPARADGPWYVAPGGNDGDTCLDASHPCATINEAISKASSGDTVYVAIGTYTGNTTSVVFIEKILILSGGWNADFTSHTGMSTIDGQNLRNGIYVASGTVTVQYFIIQNGYATEGGGINNHATLTLDHVLIANNGSYVSPGGISNVGTLTLNNSTVRDNGGKNVCMAGGGCDGITNSYGTMILINSTVLRDSIGNTSYMSMTNVTVSGYRGGYAAVHNLSGGILDLRSSTIVNNSPRGLIAENSIVHIQNTIIADNAEVDCDNRAGTGFVSQGFNMIGTSWGCPVTSTDLLGVSPWLGPLQENGGPTLTHALLPGGPAINAGNPAGCQGSTGPLTTDQRGFPRLGRCDIGAFEVNPLDFSAMTVSPAQAAAGGSVTYTITLSNNDASNIDPVSVTDTLPASLTYQPGTLNATSGIADYAAGTVTWTGAVNAGSQVRITFDAVVSQSARGTQIENDALFEFAAGAFLRSATLEVPPPWRTYLPLIIKSKPGIWGKVSYNGEPVSSVQLNLYFYNGSSWINWNYTLTNTDGSYVFDTMPALESGQAYYVRFRNFSTTPNGRLAAWYSRVITQYSTGSSYDLGTIDIGDVPLISPAPGATVPLPMTFSWYPRATTTEDNFQFELFDPSGTSDFVSPLLGFVTSYQLTSLPSGFSTNKTYSWSVLVRDPEGGAGVAYYYNPVTFSNSGAPIFQRLPGGVQRNLVDYEEELIRQMAP